MSRAIRSDRMKQPAIFTHPLNDTDELIKFKQFVERYTTVNQTGNSIPKKLDPNSAIELSVNELYRLSMSLCMSEGGRSWTECNSIIESMALLNRVSNELTLYDYIEATKTNPFVELNDYTVKLFENVGRTDRLDQSQTYDPAKQKYIDSPAYTLGLEWQEKFHEIIMDIGFPQEISSRMTISKFWRVDSLLSATERMSANKFYFVQCFIDTMPTGTAYNGQIVTMNFDKRFITEPLNTISKAVMCRHVEGYHSYDDTASKIADALRDVAFANELVALNPQVKVIGLTEISSYNHQSYYFKDELKFMTKQNTEWLDVALLPAFNTINYMMLSKHNLRYATAFMENAEKQLEEAVAEAKEIGGEKFTAGVEAMTNHWFEVVKNLYQQQKIDEIGLLYSNLMFPNMNPQNQEIFNKVIEAIQPFQQGHRHIIELGDGYSASMIIYQQAIAFQFYDVKYRNTSLTVDADYYDSVKEVIMAKGIPLYLQQPLNQIINQANGVVNQNSNLELQNVASRIYHIESQRRTKLQAIQERRLELGRQKFV